MDVLTRLKKLEFCGVNPNWQEKSDQQKHMYQAYFHMGSKWKHIDCTPCTFMVFFQKITYKNWKAFDKDNMIRDNTNTQKLIKNSKGR